MVETPRAALRAGLIPVVCVGETLAERDADALDATLDRQLTGALGGLQSGLTVGMIFPIAMLLLCVFLKTEKK